VNTWSYWTPLATLPEALARVCRDNERVFIASSEGKLSIMLSVADIKALTRNATVGGDLAKFRRQLRLFSRLCGNVQDEKVADRKTAASRRSSAGTSRGPRQPSKARPKRS